MKLRNCRIKDINELVTMVEQNNSALSFLAIHKKENILIHKFSSVDKSKHNRPSQIEEYVLSNRRICFVGIGGQWALIAP